MGADWGVESWQTWFAFGNRYLLPTRDTILEIEKGKAVENDQGLATPAVMAVDERAEISENKKKSNYMGEKWYVIFVSKLCCILCTSRIYREIMMSWLCFVCSIFGRVINLKKIKRKFQFIIVTSLMCQHFSWQCIKNNYIDENKQIESNKITSEPIKSTTYSYKNYSILQYEVIWERRMWSWMKIMSSKIYYFTLSGMM